MKIHILGICGTFMGGVAALARADGHTVSGSDQGVYPPMSTQLEKLGVMLYEGYDPAHLDPAPDLVIIGNALSRGNPMVEHVLNTGLPYVSGPAWLGENYLTRRTVLAVAGTHGKTTTASMIAWILEAAGRKPGFLIGGVPGNFDVTARSGRDIFVVEADEYDTAFFDKRAKFVHYRPRVAVLNNLEFDHADIYPDIDAIKTQFHHLVRTVPGQGSIVWNRRDPNLEQVLEMGCWSRQVTFGPSDSGRADWRVSLAHPSGRELIFHHGETSLNLSWKLCGEHNAYNALSAVAATAEVGVDPAAAVAALGDFDGVKRRLELLTDHGGIHVYDDFAHHPTAIRLTLQGLRRSVGNARILVALEPASNTMRTGVHLAELAPALAAADRVWLKTGEDTDWDPRAVLDRLDSRGRAIARVATLIDEMIAEVEPGDSVVFMSNRGFDAAPRRFVEAWHERTDS